MIKKWYKLVVKSYIPIIGFGVPTIHHKWMTMINNYYDFKRQRRKVEMNRIIITTDVHGQYTNDNFSSGSKANYGLAILSSEINKLRDENTIVIDNGDFFQGSPLMTHYFKYHQFDNPAIKALNYINYDYYNFGNHDFNYGKDELVNFIDHIDAKLINQNISIDNYIPPLTIHTFNDGMKVAIIGITTDFVKVWEQDSNLAGITINDSYQVLKEKIKEARDANVDLVIGVYHGGVEKDLETGTTYTSTSGENQGYKFCEDLDLDILFTGHEHREFVVNINDIVVTQSANKAQSMIVLEFDQQQINSPQLIKASSLDSVDEGLNKLFSDEIKIVNEWLDQPICKVDGGDYLVKDPYLARIYKHPLFSFINQVIMDLTDADLSSCGLSVDATGFETQITVRNVLATFPFSNTLQVYVTNGKVLKAYLEQAMTFFVEGNGTIAINDTKINPKNELYNYEMVDGINYTADISKPFGERIISMTKDGQAIKDTDIFTIALTNYRASGTGGYGMIKDMKFKKELPLDFTDMFIDYLIDKQVINVIDNDNIFLTIGGNNEESN